MINNKEVTDALERVSDQFEVAEKRIKKYEELYGQGLVVASLNELRYSCNHTLNALTRAESVPQALDELKKAERHCQRASYDVCAATFSDLLFRLERFRSYYIATHYKHVKDVVTDLDEHTKYYREAKKIVEEVELNDKKAEFYEKLEPLIKPIEKWVNYLYEEYIPRIELLIEEDERKLAIAKKRHDRMLWITAVSMIVTVVAVVVAIMK